MSKIYGSQPVPCGKCPACVARRTSGWSFRLMQEEKHAISSHFITLTYDTKHVPITKKGFMDINKDDIQKFFKRLRKAHEGDNTPSIKYYTVGEYGGKTARPHYHAIIFNARIELIEKTWQLGNIHYGTVEGASIGYTLKYMSKKRKIPMHQNDDRTPEFALMSKGLGASYITLKMQKWHFKDINNRLYCQTLDGKKIAMPRYYKEKIFDSKNVPEVLKGAGYVARQNMLNEKSKIEQPSSRDLAEAHLAAFRKMEKNSSKGDKI